MSRRRTVLVLTGPEDPTADAVIAELQRRRSRISRLDLGDFPIRVQIAAHHSGRPPDDGMWTGQIVGPSGAVVLSDVQSIYYRRPSRFTFPAELSTADRAYAEAEARIGLGGVLGSLNCLWVSHPHDVARAEWKPLQLQVAASVGLATPRTLVTNNVAAVRSFARDVAGAVVCKTIVVGKALDRW